MIQGGWEFVWAAYGITWTGLALYTMSLWRRQRLIDPPPTSQTQPRGVEMLL